MTVKELRELLAKYPDNLEVMYREEFDEDGNFWDDAAYYPIYVDIHTPYDLNCNRLDDILYIDKK